MNPIIDVNWIPDKRSTDALKNKGYSVKQLNHIRRCFIKRNLNKEMANASTEYSNMVKASGAGHDVPKPDLSAQVEREENQDKARAKRSKQPEAKLAAVKSNDKPFTREEAIVEYEKRRL